jgi:hypothetical protein
MSFPLALVCSTWMDEMMADLYTGCALARCRYCIPPGRKWAAEFGPLPDDLALLEKRVRIRTGDPLNLEALTRTRAVRGAMCPPVWLSGFSDPYPALEETAGVTRQAIAQLHHYGVGARILSKAGTRPCRDFQAPGANGRAGYAPALGSHPDDAYGATVTLVDDKDSRHWEPGAALPAERMEGLREAYRRGIPTWINVAPVIDPEQALEVIRQTHEFCDLYWVAGMGVGATCRAELEQFYWPTFADKVVRLCRKYETPVGVGYGDDSTKMGVDAAGETVTEKMMWERMDSAMTDELWRQQCSKQKPQWRLALWQPWTAARLRADLEVRCVRQCGLG